MYVSIPIWTITYTAGDCSSAASYQRRTREDALAAFARDEGYASFAAYCTGRDRAPSDFTVFPDYW
jgi:hypothetical protein